MVYSETMGRKAPFVLLVGLLAMPLYAMSNEAKAAYVAKIRADAARNQVATAAMPDPLLAYVHK